MKFSIKDFFSKCDQIRSFLRIWSHLLKKSLMEDFIFCAVVKVKEIIGNFFVNVILNSFFYAVLFYLIFFVFIKRYSVSKVYGKQLWLGVIVTLCRTKLMVSHFVKELSARKFSEHKSET